MEKAAKTGIAILLYLLLFALAADTARADAPDPCALFTKGEAEALMGMETASVRQSDAVSPAGRVCTYFFKKDGRNTTVWVAEHIFLYSATQSLS